VMPHARRRIIRPMRTPVPLLLLLLLAPAIAGADPRVTQRRAAVAIICHRGASEFAHENTLDAYRATFELGGEGNEIDVRATRDGVLVCFHDDMLDMLLSGAYGDVADHTWAELQTFPFRNPGPMAATCSIPTLEQALWLHRQFSGLVMLDVKQPGLDDAIAEVLDKTKTWEHVIGVNAENAPKLAKDPRIKLRRIKAGLFGDRSDVFPDKIAAALKLPGDDLIVDDPRAAIVAMGDKFGGPSPRSAPEPARAPADDPPLAQLVGELRVIAETNDTKRMIARARAADAMLERRVTDPAALAALTEAAGHRTLHKEWIYGMDLPRHRRRFGAARVDRLEGPGKRRAGARNPLGHRPGAAGRPRSALAQPAGVDGLANQVRRDGVARIITR
jgi:hypothetical protein